MACYMLSQFITCCRNPLHELRHAHSCNRLLDLFCRTILQLPAFGVPSLQHVKEVAVLAQMKLSRADDVLGVDDEL
jgi:hypothetical protein